jgi:hypothetical protein
MRYLTELGNKYGTDRASVVGCKHNYTEIYDEIFGTYRHDVKRVLEIGTYLGAGLKMWQDYFPNATIYGLEYKRFPDVKYDDTDERIISVIGDQTSRTDWSSFIDTYGGDFDIIIDDGEHDTFHHQISMGMLFKHLNSDGCYIIEDLFTTRATDTRNLITTYEQSGKIVGSHFTEDERKYIASNIKSHIKHNGYWRGNSKNPGSNDILKLWVVTKK